MPREQLVAEFASILQDAAPGRRDHVRPGRRDRPSAITCVVGAAATEAFHAARATAAGGFARLLHVGIPQSSLDRFNELLRQRGMEPIDPTQDFQPRGIADETIGVVVDGTSVYERKLEALRRHRTQAELQDVPFELWREMLARESFVLAFPERAPGDPVLHDVFEGLPDP